MTMLNASNPSVFSLSPLSRQLDEMFKSMFTPVAGVRAFPPLNAWASETAVTIEAELPGFRLQDIEITMVNRELTIKGTREVARPEQAQAYLAERTSGEFSRTVRLAVPVDAERVSASMKDGVLTITLPKAAAAQPRKIAVRAGDN